MTSEHSPGVPSAAGPVRREITVRRAPKFVPFLIAGGIIGIIAAIFVTLNSPPDPNFTQGAVLGFFCVVLIIPGLLLGALAALVFDYISVKRARRATVEAADESEA